MQNIISTPLELPRIVPADWSTWWPIWYKESKTVQKIHTNHNQYSAQWRGFDLWVKPGIDAAETTHYNAKNLDRPDLFPSIFDNLDKFPIDIEIVRFVSSMGAVYPHTDQESEMLSVRSLVYDNNVTPTFYYTDGNYRKYQTLPTDTNTWMYWDNKQKHGTDWFFGHSKILITYFGKMKESIATQMFVDNANKYKDYIITHETI
jgi:hypothetical protein